ncbi:MAG: DUF2240 family protein [Candidatus Lokiarchaeota archaeon]|nr:DUF2240 family protein [Candidatus Harpocratesius repetitus]
MDFEETIQKIINQTGLTPSEIKEKIQEQIQELSGLIDEEGAIVIVAKNLGVDLKENQNAASLDADQKIGELTANKNANIVGRIVNIGDVKTFSKKDGTQGSLLPFFLEDTSGMIRCIAWGEFNTQIANESGFTKGEILRIVNGFVKHDRNQKSLEIHIGSKSRIQLQPDNVDNRLIPKKNNGNIKITKIIDLSLSLPFVNVEGLITGIYGPKPFQRKDGSEGKRASLGIRDDTDIVFITFWGDHCDKLNNIELNQYVQITFLTPKANYRDKSKIDLTATTNTKIIPINPSDSSVPILIEKIQAKTRTISDLTQKGGFGTIEAVIQEIEENRTISTRDGRQIDLMKIIIADETGALRLNLWGDKVDPNLQIHQSYRFEEVSVKLNNFSNQYEGTLARTGQIAPIEKSIKTTHTIEQPKKFLPAKEATIEEINQAEFYSIKATLIRDIRRITIYRACSKCNRKIDNCQCNPPGDQVNRMILNISLDDETGILRATLMGERAENFLNTKTDRIKELEDAGELEHFLKMKNLELVGKEFQFRGKTRYSDYSNEYEMSINSFQELDPKEEIENLLKNLNTTE